MEIKTLEVENFRNYAAYKADFSQKALIVGDNGTGKSSLLEAIRLFSVGKSFRTPRLDEVIKFDQSLLRLRATLGGESADKLDFFYGVQFSENPIKERRLVVDSQELSWLEYLGKFPSVLFTPTDMEIATGSPQVRRRYVDSVLWQVDREFRQAYLDLSRILRERASLLFLVKINRASRDEIKPWTELLLRSTTVIREGRSNFINYARERFEAVAPLFTRDLTFDVTYSPNDVIAEEVESKEIQSSQNLVGPHRDEIDLVLNDRLVRTYASRGQARTAVALLKVVEASFLSDKTMRLPVVLLDDILSELDEKNAGSLFEALGDRYQIIATSITDVSMFDQWQKIELSHGN